MSKRAEEKAIEYQLKTYGPVVLGGDNILSEEEHKVFNINKDYKNGYEQAEKDLELTWRDLENIIIIVEQVECEWLKSCAWDGIRDFEFYREVLRRFLEFKNK